MVQEFLQERGVVHKTSNRCYFLKMFITVKRQLPEDTQLLPQVSVQCIGPQGFSPLCLGTEGSIQLLQHRGHID